MIKPEPSDLFSKSRGAPPPGERGMKRLKNSKAGSFSSNGKGITWRCPRVTWVVLMLTTACPCFSASSVKSGSPRVCALAKEQKKTSEKRTKKRFIGNAPPDSARILKRYEDDPQYFQSQHENEIRHIEWKAPGCQLPPIWHRYPPSVTCQLRPPQWLPAMAIHRQNSPCGEHCRPRWPRSPSRRLRHLRGCRPDMSFVHCRTSASGSDHRSRPSRGIDRSRLLRLQRRPDCHLPREQWRG